MGYDKETKMKSYRDIYAKVIADSVSKAGVRLTTVECFYPRMVHADFMTHRVFSRNASSSRATPVMTMLEKTRADLYVPRFRYNKPGMQPGSYLEPESQKAAEVIWMEMAKANLKGVGLLANLGIDGTGVHKQWANRPLEWFGWIKVVVTSTDWANFFALRRDVDNEGYPMAQDEIKYLADRIWDGLNTSTFKTLLPGQWHVPYVDDDEIEQELVRTKSAWGSLCKMSAARCARTSRLDFDGSDPSMERDHSTYRKLSESRPIHASPMEHQATPDWMDNSNSFWVNKNLHGNFFGWIQNRQTIRGHTAKDIRYSSV